MGSVSSMKQGSTKSPELKEYLPLCALLMNKPFRPLIFIGQSNLIDCVRDEGVKDGCRSEEVLEGR